MHQTKGLRVDLWQLHICISTSVGHLFIILEMDWLKVGFQVKQISRITERKCELNDATIIL